jgi:hypothetical protein
LARSAISGPDWLSGGAFGPEASVVSVAVCLLASLAIGALIVRARGWRPRSFRLALA